MPIRSLLLFAAISISFSAHSQFTDTLRNSYPRIVLRDSANPVILDEIRISESPNNEAPTYHDHSGTTAIEDYLTRAPGIALISRGAFGKEPVLRGMNTDRVQVTIDGMPVRHACVGKMDPATSYVESNNLEKLEVEAGGEGLQLTSTTGGNLNLQTLDPRLGNKLFYGNSGLKYTTNGRGTMATLQTGWREKGWGLLANATYHQRDNYRAGDGATIDNAQYHKFNMALAGKWKVRDHQFIDADVIVDEAWKVGYPALPMDVPQASARIAGLEWKVYEPAPGLNWWKLKVFANRVKHVMDNFSRNQYSMRMTMPGETTVAGIRSRWQWQKASRTFDMQIDASRHTSTASMTMFPENEQQMFMLTLPDIHQYLISAFAHYGWQWENYELSIGGKLQGSGAFSHDEAGIKQWQGLGQDISGMDHRISGGVHLKIAHPFSGRWRWFAKGTYLHRIPNVPEQYGLYIYNAQDNYAYLGNPAIRNETSLQAVAGVGKKGSHVHLKGEAYYYQFYDYIIGVVHEAIDPLSPSHNGVKQYLNLPSASVAGAEARATWLVNETLIFQSTISCVRGVDHAGFPLPQIPPLSSDFGVKFLYKRAFLSTEAITALRQGRTSRYAGEDVTPGYLVWNAAAGCKWELSGHTLALKIWAQNLTNTYYWHHLDWNNLPQPGRNVSLALQWKF